MARDLLERTAFCTTEQAWAREGLVLNLGAQHQPFVLGPALHSLRQHHRPLLLHLILFPLFPSLWLLSLRHAFGFRGQVEKCPSTPLVP